jgi:hypothetical protein
MPVVTPYTMNVSNPQISDVKAVYIPDYTWHYIAFLLLIVIIFGIGIGLGLGICMYKRKASSQIKTTSDDESNKKQP